MVHAIQPKEGVIELLENAEPPVGLSEVVEPLRPWDRMDLPAAIEPNALALVFRAFGVGALTYPVLRSHQILKLFAEKGHFPVDVIDLVAQGLWDDAGDCVVGGHR